MDNNDIPSLSDEQLRELKTQYNKAKDLLEKITSLHLRYDTAVKTFELKSSDVEKVTNDVREKSTTVENLKNDSVTFLGELKSNLEKVQFSITQVEEGYAKFQNLYGKVEGKEGEINALTSAAIGLKNDIETAKLTAQQRLADIELQLVLVQEKVATMESAYNSFVAIQAKITDDKTGLQAILNGGTDLKRMSTEVFAEIKSFSSESKKLIDEINQNKKQSGISTQEIQTHLDSTKDNILRIKEVTALITDTGFANSFQKREKILRISAATWLVVFIASLGGLVWMIYILFIKGNPGIPEIQTIIYRLTLTSPLLFLTGVAIKQYSNERNLNERYAFKATIAAVVRSHVDFLMAVTEKSGVENTRFLRESLSGVYFEPYEKRVAISEIKKELQKILEEKFGGRKSRMPDFVNGIKELREVLPDDMTLKSVIEYYLKSK